MEPRSLAAGAAARPAERVERPALPGCRVEVVADEGAFMDMQPLWDALVEEAGIDHPFLRHSWIRTWWDCFGAERRLQILVVRAGADPVAIAPLMLDETRLCGLRVRRIGSLTNDHVPRFDFIVARRPQEACRAIWSHLLHEAGPWDVLQLCQLPEGSHALAQVARLARAEGLPVGRWRAADSPYAPLCDWDGYVMSLSHNRRGQVRKRLRRLQRLGQVGLESIDEADRLDEALDDGLRLEACGWKTGTGTAILGSPRLRDFYTHLARAAASSGSLRLLFLTVGGVRVAFAYALCHANKLYVLKSGYDPSYATYSPYNVLTYLVLENACRRRLDEYDFLGGPDEWKLHWTGLRRPHHWLYVFRDTRRARLLHWVKFQVAPLLGRVPPYRLLRDALRGPRCTFRAPRS